MDRFATSHFSNRALVLEVKSSDLGERVETAVVLSRLAEFDERRLFLEEGFPSMHAFLVRELQYTEERAAKRIYAARTARRFPLLLIAMAEGRLHLSGLVTLARYLTSGNSDELVAAASGKTRAEIERLIADRFPKPDLPQRLEPIASPPTMVAAERGEHSPGNAGDSVHLQTPGSTCEDSPGNADAAVLLPPASAREDSPGNPPPARWPSVKPLAPQRYGFQCTLDQETHDLLQRMRELTSHEIPSGDMVQVLKTALQLAVGQLEKRKFAATSRPGATRPSANPRHIPAAVKRAVWERDGGQCAFVGDSGKRCPARRMLEFDHEVPVARGGEATVENTRLHCRAHNQHAAERVFGVEFMERKRA